MAFVRYYVVLLMKVQSKQRRQDHERVRHLLNPARSVQDFFLSALLICTLVVIPGPSPKAQDNDMGGTLEQIRERGSLVCGVSAGVAGFSRQDERGNYAGFDVDYCRALAAALFGDDSRVEYAPLSAADRFDALANGEVDVLFRNTTWTLSRDIDGLIDFAAINFYDGQGFMVRADSSILAFDDLASKTVCVQVETTTDQNMTDLELQKNIAIDRLYFESLEPAKDAYLEGECDAITSDSSALAGIRSQFDRPTDHRILKDLISKEPLALAVRQGDDELRDLVAWTVFAMIGAEELGVNQTNVEEIYNTTDNRTIRRLLGIIESEEDTDIGSILLLEPDWAYKIIRQVGNYADVFNNNLGPETAIGLDRGLNALYTDGGILYAPPMR